MIAWFIVLLETENKIFVAYSVEQNDTCDGRLIYNKDSDTYSIIKECYNEGYHGMFGPIVSKLRNGQFTINKKICIAIG